LVQYRRNFVPGGTYFFTVTLRDRRQRLFVEHIESLRAAMRHVRSLHPWRTDAIVVLPEHLHSLWTLPDNDHNYPLRWRMIKSLFTKRLREVGAWSSDESPWQARYWEHTIRDDRDFEMHVNYIHFNPVKHGHAMASRDWPHSSFHRFVREGVLPVDWACDPGEHPNE
jgi:putative transposase